MSTGGAVVTFMGQCQKDIISLHYWRPADDEFCLWKLFPLSISPNLRIILFCFLFSQHLCDQVQSHLNKLHLCDQNHQNFAVSSSPATMEEAALISDMLLSDADMRWPSGEGIFNFPGSPIECLRPLQRSKENFVTTLPALPTILSEIDSFSTLLESSVDVAASKLFDTLTLPVAAASLTLRPSWSCFNLCK